MFAPGRTTWLLLVGVVTTAATPLHQVRLTNRSAASLPAGTTVSVAVDTQAEVDAGRLRVDCADLLMAYGAPDAGTPLALALEAAPGAADCATSVATRVYFPLGRALAPGESDEDYWLWGNEPGAADGGMPLEAFRVGTKPALLVCPFWGGERCFGAPARANPATGQVRQPPAGGVARLGGSTGALQTTAPLGDGSTPWTVEGWARLDALLPAGGSRLPLLSSQALTANGACNTPYGLVVTQPSPTEVRIAAQVPHANATSACHQATEVVSGPLTLGQWYHLAATWTPPSTLTLFVQGVAVGSATRPAGAVDEAAFRVQSAFFGSLDEVRVSDRVRYTGTFTPPTRPLPSDSNALLLLHFDEGGADPRVPGLGPTDASPSARSSTFTGRWVAGGSGFEVGASDRGPVAPQAFASLRGAYSLIDRVNEVPNPSFEHPTFPQGWTAGSALSAALESRFAWVGPSAARLTAGAGAPTVATHGFVTSIASGTGVHTVSFYAFDDGLGTAGGPLTSATVRPVLGGAVTSLANTTYTPVGGGWWRVVGSGTVASSPTTFGVQLEPNTAVLVDGVQLEDGSQETTYLDGTLGPGHSWTGAAHQSASTRINLTLAYFNVAQAAAKNASSTVVAWMQVPPQAHDLWTNDQFEDLIDFFNGSPTEDMRLRKADQGLNRRLEAFGWKSGNTAYRNQSFQRGHWHHLGYAWRATSSAGDFIRLFADGTSAGGNNFNGATPVEQLGPMMLGHGLIYADLRTYDGALTDAEMAAIYHSSQVEGVLVSSGLADGGTTADGGPPSTHDGGPAATDAGLPESDGGLRVDDPPNGRGTTSDGAPVALRVGCGCDNRGTGLLGLLSLGLLLLRRQRSRRDGVS